jgi:hypothetical protein
MKELDLKGYPIGDGQADAKYDIRVAVANVLLSPELRLNGAALLVNHKLASRISDCKEDTILLEDSEHQQLVQAINTIRGFGKWDVEFVRRTIEASEVTVGKA